VAGGSGDCIICAIDVGSTGTVGEESKTCLELTRAVPNTCSLERQLVFSFILVGSAVKLSTGTGSLPVL
jgi:hypothetical protein